MSIDTIKQNAEILNEAVIKFNSYTLELQSLEKSLETSKDRKSKKLLHENLSAMKIKISDLLNYILKVQLTLQKLVDEELQYNAQ